MGAQDEISASNEVQVTSNEKIAVVTESDEVGFDKSELHIDDEAGEIAAQALASGPADAEVSRKVLRKIDLYILPFLCITYGLQFLDKTTLGYSSVFGIIPDNHLKGQDYAWASSIFYFGYMMAEYPGVALMQRFPIAKFLGINIIIWASILMITATCSSFAGLATVRFLLGMFEATISPGFVAITGIWWTRQEQASRSAIWVSFLGFFGTIGGLITFGIGHIEGSLATWKLIFLILGAFTIVWGVLFLLVVPDNPATARWLTQEERVVAVQRVVENKTGTKSTTFVKAQVLEALTDPKILLLGLISFVNAVASGGLSFGSIIIRGFGFTPLETTLMNMPLSFLQAVFTLMGGYAQHKFPNARLIVGSVAMIPPIIGTVLINQLNTHNKWGRLVGVWLLAGYPTGFMVLLGLLATNVAGSTKKSMASAMVFVMYCVGQIVGPQCFKAKQAPAYHGGIVAMLIGFILNIVFNLTLRFLYQLENRKRDRALEEKTQEEIEALKDESRLQGFDNVTDKYNVFFRYSI
ncbi:major facilitator superfamily domain-containing protein [Leptodontidium sp. MPI-SDFR-AT-0119]|nr:major facilitator superfamily domain-containing protein [Leptodontidium sp. MPI-SDFR-AT-0119]